MNKLVSNVLSGNPINSNKRGRWPQIIDPFNERFERELSARADTIQLEIDQAN